MTDKKIAVLCGGDGKEREVSLKSGAAVHEALKDSGFNVEIIDLHSMNEIERVRDFDAVFIAMHGDWGEGGQLQEKLSEMGIIYTGSGPQASSNAMNKWKARELFASVNINIPEGLLLPADYDEIINKLGRNVVVKPCSGGSTVGITIIHDLTPEKLNDAIKTARANYDSDVMIEKYINGRELTCAVWEHDGKIEALPVIEIAPHTGFYDYTNKYTAGATEYIVPAKIDGNAKISISDMAVKAHKVLGCKEYSRADFRLTPENKAFILEVNTAPGMTATSLVPKAAKAAGVSMSDFVKFIMNEAINNAADRK
ncbi:MAG: D-alanine--D-alanine ligase [Synergistaceae bacterium]|nr:D-alanine--D-alanine ligase [Synergistaceae bacterium]